VPGSGVEYNDKKGRWNQERMYGYCRDAYDWRILSDEDDVYRYYGITIYSINPAQQLAKYTELGA